MKFLRAFVAFAILSSGWVLANDSSEANKLTIARTVRLAVRQADSTLLAAPSLKPWRDYMKVAALNLDPHLQPLLLIKFDEDSGFRSQLKSIIGWESRMQKKETEHFIYYYSWDQPLPDMISEFQTAHFNELVRLFQIDPAEKIAYRFDLTGGKNVVFPFDDLRGGIITSHPLDLHLGALAILYLINSEPPSLLQPLARLYGDYFQNPSTSEAYYEMCLDKLHATDYVSAADLYRNADFSETQSQEWYSAFAFAYELDREFGPARISKFLAKLYCDMEPLDFQNHFAVVFGMDITEFENRFHNSVTAVK